MAKIIKLIFSVFILVTVISGCRETANVYGKLKKEGIQLVKLSEFIDNNTNNPETNDPQTNDPQTIKKMVEHFTKEDIEQLYAIDLIVKNVKLLKYHGYYQYPIPIVKECHTGNTPESLIVLTTGNLKIFGTLDDEEFSKKFGGNEDNVNQTIHTLLLLPTIINEGVLDEAGNAKDDLCIKAYTGLLELHESDIKVSSNTVVFTKNEISKQAKEYLQNYR